MIDRSVRRLLSPIVTVAVMACSSAPAYFVDGEPFSTTSAPLEQRTVQIKNAGVFRGWDMNEVGPGQILGRLDVRKREVVVLIDFTPDHFSIHYDPGTSKYNGETVNKRFNNYVKDLESGILQQSSIQTGIPDPSVGETSLQSPGPAKMQASFNPVAKGAASTKNSHVNFRCPDQGTVIKTSSGRSLEVEGASGFACKLSNQFGEFVQYAGFASGDAKEAVREAAEHLWPISIGKETTAQYTGSGDSGTQNTNVVYWRKFKVVAAEPISVRAGTFNAYRVEVEESSNSDSYHDRATYWWSPELGYIVKYRFIVLRGVNHNSPKDWEVVNVIKPN